jgi:NTP pyrophosphatase (non-canonical NTP hydrolase)
MNTKHFSRFVKETATLGLDHPDSLAYCTLGLNGEAGEVAELVKKSMRTGRPLDKVEVAMELGDVAWYTERTAQTQDITLDQVLEIVVMKLTRRKLHGKDHAAEYAEAKRILGL